MPSQDRTSGNSPLCPTGYRLFRAVHALTPLLQLITQSKASGTADHLRSFNNLFAYLFYSSWNYCDHLKQGRIHGNTVADGWAGAVVQKLLEIQKCYGTDTAKCIVACPRLKKTKKSFTLYERWTISQLYHLLNKG